MSAGALLVFSSMLMGYLVEALIDKPIALYEYNKRNPVLKQTDEMDIETLDFINNAEFIIGGGAMALAVGLAVSANKVKK